MHPGLTPLGMGKLPDTSKACQDFPQSITADGIKGFGQVYKNCIWTYVLFSAFLLYLPQHKDHVCSPSVGPEPTLAFWHVFLCFCWDEPVQQEASQDFACSGELGDASTVLTVCFFSLVFVQRDNVCIPEVLW